MRIYLLRHGATQGNLEQRYVGRTDEPLCEQGRLPAQRLGKRLEGEQIEAVLTSPLLRCRQTAALLFPGKTIALIDGLEECDFGEFEYKNYEELAANEAYQRWLDAGGTTGFPGGESRDAFIFRCADAFQKSVEALEERGVKTAAYVVHGGTIMAVLSRFARPEEDYFHWQVGACGGFLVETVGTGLRDGCRVLQKLEGERA
ncbi:histidine phosphatase family protein [Zongyangia hominis]|uniref:Histidine phosphatase family protein n=1 Tax=Zongyangia hominis TaxID=2763677 RepID=A0A926EBX9_9FIRM|nr:histidine phosphatase family protein [Zongyangia hominis]MBC8569301.1 histidine phosphatase family protein [Zongyangia hominis]